MSEHKDKKEKRARKLGGTELTRCKKECDEYLNGWKRAKADFINYKKEEHERFDKTARVQKEKLIQELVTVLDSFTLGIMANKDDVMEKRGVELIYNQFVDTLKRYGLKKIPIKAGDMFDPTKHEAVTEVESNKPEGTIVEEIESGYILHDKVLRPVRVVLSKGKKTKN